MISLLSFALLFTGCSDSYSSDTGDYSNFDLEESYEKFAEYCFAHKNYGAAAKAYSGLISIRGNKKDLLQGRAAAYELMEDYDKALSDYETLLSQNSFDSEAYEKVKHYSLKNKDWDRLISLYSEAHEGSPLSDNAILRRVSFFIQNEDYEGAKEALYGVSDNSLRELSLAALDYYRSKRELKDIEEISDNEAMASPDKAKEEHSDFPIAPELLQAVSENTPIYFGNLNSDGEMDGEGLIISGNSVYEGWFKNGYKQGIGTEYREYSLDLGNGCSYNHIETLKGRWYHGLPDGLCDYSFKNMNYQDGVLRYIEETAFTADYEYGLVNGDVIETHIYNGFNKRGRTNYAGTYSIKRFLISGISVPFDYKDKPVYYLELDYKGRIIYIERNPVIVWYSWK